MAVCYAATAPIFQPARRILSDITNDEVPTVTTTTDHNYLDGEIVRFYLPEGYGMRKLNRKLAIVTVTAADQFTIDIDTTDFNPFTTPSSFPFDEQCAQVVPVGEITATFKAAFQNVLRRGSR